MTTYHLLEVRRPFRAEISLVKDGAVTVEQMEAGTRFEAQVRPFVVNGVERADLYLPTCTYRNVRFRDFMFIDREG